MNPKQLKRTEAIPDVIDQSQHMAAKIAGFTLIFSIAIVVISNYSVTFRYVVTDATETARNMLEHETAFRFNIFCNLIYTVSLIIMSSSFYVILKRVNNNFALAATLTRFIYAFMWGIMAINTLGALRLLDNAGFLKSFETGQLYALSRLNLNSNYFAYYVGLPFWGLASAIVSYLLYKSKYIPKALAAFGIISSVWCVFCAFAYIVFPDYGKIVHLGLFDVPLTIFEIILGFWFLVKGLRAHPISDNQ